MTEEPTRPDTIPAEAEWEPNANEWFVGETKNGEPIGEWNWFAATGYLVRWTEFNDAGVMTGYRCFRPCGKMSREGTLLMNGKWHEDFYCFS